MNKKQYSAIGFFFLGLVFYTMIFKTAYINSLFSYQTFEIFKHFVDVGILFIIMISFPLFILFQILATLEPRKRK
jgi:hypothetical protein